MTQTPSPKTSPPPQPQHISSTETTHHKTHPRGTPSLIQFVGKREHKKVEPTTTSAVASSSPSSPIQTNPTIGIWSSQQMAGYNAAWFGRPTLSPAEIEAIESGGASTLKF